MLAPETNGEVAVKAWAVARKASPGASTPHLAIPKEDEKIRFRDVVAQPRKIISSPIWSGLEIGEGLLQRRLHQRPRTDPVADADRPPAALPGSSVDARLRRGVLRLPAADRHQDRQAGDRPQAERQRAGRAELHHPAPEVGHPLDLYRQPADADAVARRADRLDQRGRRARPASSTTTGSRPTTPTARWSPRAVVSQRVKQGMCMMYHAQEKIVNVPGSRASPAQRGGIHNSVTRSGASSRRT